MVNILEKYSYSFVAEEYYDLERHPTCAAFRELSVAFLVERLANREFDRALEVGAGRSSLAELRSLGVLTARHLTVTDSEESMLAESRQFYKYIDDLRLIDVRDEASASNLTGPFDLVAAVLADPYDDELFWRFLRRAVSEGATVLVTTPSYCWADAFRATEPLGRRDVALFESSIGKIWLPSIIRPIQEQLDLMKSHGFRPMHVAQLGAAAMKSGLIAPKLAVALERNLPIITGYEARRVACVDE